MYDAHSNKLYASQLADEIRTHTNFDVTDKSVELDVCFAGKSTASYYSLAQHLADILRVPVTGPTLHGYMPSNGVYSVESGGVQKVFYPNVVPYQ